MEHAIGEHRAVCVSGTAFAFVALLERLEADLRHFHAMPGSRIMETGGFKGRTRAVHDSERTVPVELWVSHGANDN